MGWFLSRSIISVFWTYKLRSPHLLAPTASDLNKYGQKDTILAGFHTDLNFLTIHGRSRYPGLHIWARNTGSRIAVKIPPGNYLLVQAGKQLEHITGGLIKAGFHEVIVNEKTIETIEKRKREVPDRPLVRISSTLFWHLGSDIDLTPVPNLVARAKEVRERQKEMGRDEGRETEYPSMKVGHQVQAYVDTPFGNQPYLSLTTIQGIETYCSDDLIASSQADIRAIVYDCTERKLATDGLARVDKENPTVEYGLR